MCISTVLLALILTVLSTSRITLGVERTPGCYYSKVYPLVIDAVKEPVGDIYSARFDEGKYSNNAWCDYTIKATPGYIIKLTFIEMDIEVYDRCIKDKVTVVNGEDMDDEIISAFCGNKPPSFPIVSTKNFMRLNFRTDEQIQRKGFHARYEVILPSEICPSGQHKCRNNRCYRPEQKCDRKDDCLDGTDEENCNMPLPSYECGNGAISPIESVLLGNDRIVGGIEAQPHSWPWQADMQIGTTFPNSHQCGGTLINPQWVMTAAHCLTGYVSAKDWRIHLGSHNRYKTDKYEQIRFVDKIVLYPDFVGDDVNGQAINLNQDIALMKLNAPVEITEGVRPACLAPQGYTEEIGTKCMVTGWGYTRGSGSHDVLKQAELYVQSEEDCPSGKRDIQICVDTRTTPQGVCHGDSGGPLSCKINDKWHVLGIASFVTGSNMMSGLCGVPGTKNVYNRVSNKISWINQMIQNNS